MESKSVIGLSAAVVLAGLLSAGAQSNSESPDLPPEFEQLVERGALVSIDDPVFVPGDEAEIAPEAWVLGVVIDGEARAYSLSLLNSHEVVNDEIAGRPLAAVW